MYIFLYKFLDNVSVYQVNPCLNQNKTRWLSAAQVCS